VTTVPIAADYTTAGTATFAWKDVGSNPITRVSVAASLSPVTLGGVAPAWTGSISLMCVAFGSGRACLNYTYGSTNVSFQTTAYTGYYVAWLYAGGAAVRSDCALTGSLTPSIWTRAELHVDYNATTGANTISILFGGTTVASCSGAFDADTVSTISVGPTTTASTTYAYTMYYDNVVAYVAR
jgi:hypothetical protein